MKQMNRRDFEIKLGVLVMESLATGLKADEIVEALKVKLAEELRVAGIQTPRRHELLTADRLPWMTK